MNYSNHPSHLNTFVQAILVPQGAEHRAVCRGLRGVLNPPTAIPIPIGPVPLTNYLISLQQAGCFYEGQTVLVMGLCGGLVPDLSVKDVVLYHECLVSTPHSSLVRLSAHAEVPTSLPCDRLLTKQLQDKLDRPVNLVKAVTCDRVISTAVEKQQLAQRSQAAVVDMEGFTVLDLLTKIGASVAMLRIVSDDCNHDIPDLSAAITPHGSLNSLALASAMLRQPAAAAHLIRGSLHGLQAIQQLTSVLFQN